MTAGHALRALHGVLTRELLRFLQQRARFFAALVRPLIWLFVFAAGFRAALGLSIIPPYETYVPYEVYITPGLIAMIQLFNGMQSSLSMVYDREMGSMRVLLTSPLPRWYVLFCKLLSSTLVSLLQVYCFLAITPLVGVKFPLAGYFAAAPALVLTGMLMGAIGLFLSSLIRQLENFAGVMNFVIFPVFFASTALYPLSRLSDANAVLAEVARLNPFSHAVELLRFALYGRLETAALLTTTLVAVAAMALAVWRYDSGRILRRQLAASP
jgi:ABC-2 type transport system permease protein